MIDNFCNIAFGAFINVKKQQMFKKHLQKLVPVKDTLATSKKNVYQLGLYQSGVTSVTQCPFFCKNLEQHRPKS